MITVLPGPPSQARRFLVLSEIRFNKAKPKA
jgi:hypothetical protein